MLILSRYSLLIGLCAITLTACNSSPNASGIPSSVTTAKVSPDGSGKPPELFNQILPYPCYSSQPCPSDFEVVYQGNVTAEIHANLQLNIHENAFCDPSGTQSCAPTVTYNATSNTTTVEWSGPVVYHNRRDNRPGVHFGLANANVPAAVLSKLTSEWTYASSGPAPMPIVSINSKQPKKSGKWQYAVVYLAGSTSPSGTAQYATWNEIPYVAKANAAGTQPKITFANYGNQTIYVTSSGIVTGLAVPTDPTCIKDPNCKEDLALLGNLDATGFPPPGSSSSPFVPLQHPPKVLKPQK